MLNALQVCISRHFLVNIRLMYLTIIASLICQSNQAVVLINQLFIQWMTLHVRLALRNIYIETYATKYFAIKID